MRHRRRGSIYVLVLGAAMIVMVIGLSALMAVRVERRAAEGSSDLAQARFYAQSAVEIGLLRIARNPTWRTTYTSGAWVTDQAIGNGTFSLDGVDPADDDLSDSPVDPLVLTGTGFKGEARYRLQATLTAEMSGLSCLEVALHAGNDLNFTEAVVQCNQTISANNSVTETTSTIHADVEAVNMITGTGYTQTTTTAIRPRDMPDSGVFDYYVANGTGITIGSIPSSQIENVVLSPTSNPYSGGTNPEGIYVIDCGGLDITVRDCRILGTLVLLDPGGGSKIESSVHFEPAVGNYPSLLVQGSIFFEFTQSPLDETQRGVNFNPPGTPYQTLSNTDMTDSFPSRIGGLVYVSGNLTTANDMAIDGVLVVGGSVATQVTIDLTYRSTYLANPPPGFFVAPKMVVSPGSWRPVVGPP